MRFHISKWACSQFIKWYLPVLHMCDMGVVLITTYLVKVLQSEKLSYNSWQYDPWFYIWNKYEFLYLYLVWVKAPKKIIMWKLWSVTLTWLSRFPLHLCSIVFLDLSLRYESRCRQPCCMTLHENHSCRSFSMVLQQ